MDTTEISILHHVMIVLFFLWLLYSINWCSSIAFLVSFVYLLTVHERYIVRLRKKLQFEERKQANQKRVLSDSETVRWLNHAVEKLWPICMEKIASQKILLPIVPWFLEKYKPWMAKKAVVQQMYLGRNPPMFTEMRVLNPSTGDDHLVLELGMNFHTADDMSTMLVVKLRKRLGFGMWTKLHMTGMHIEGKVLVGVKFLRHWPFIGRLRVCFSEPPYFQMTVKPLFTHGLDVTVLPGIAGWLDNLLALAFEQTLVQPNMLVVNVEKFVSPQEESWFSVDEKEPVAFVSVEIVEASDMKPSDLNGLADPYVKGQLGLYRFRTSTQKKTLSPKWQEEFKIWISSWDLPNVLAIEVRDKDHFLDDNLGNCTININDFRDGERHDLWLPLHNIKMGRIHLAITVVDENPKVSMPSEVKNQDEDERKNSLSDETINRPSLSSISSDEPAKVSDKFEPINIEDQEEPGVWVYQPGTQVSPTWETRKGKSRHLDNPVERVPSGSSRGNTTAVPAPISVNNSSPDETADGNSQNNSFQRGLRKIGSVFRRSPKGEGTENSREIVQSPCIGPVDEDTRVRLVMEGADLKILNNANDKGVTKSILTMDKKSFRQTLSRKESDKSRSNSSVMTERENDIDSDSSNDDSLSSPQVHKSPTIPNPMSCCFNGSPAENNAPSRSVSKKLSIEGQEKMHYDRLSSARGVGTGLEGTSKPPVTEENLTGEKN